jgi:hypothetical protein
MLVFLKSYCQYVSGICCPRMFILRTGALLSPALKRLKLVQAVEDLLKVML